MLKAVVSREYIYPNQNHTKTYIVYLSIVAIIYIGKVKHLLKGYSGFKNPFSRLSFLGFKIIFDHTRVHIPDTGSLALS